MRDGIIIQILLVALGGSMFITAFLSLVRRKMSEVVVIPWGIGSIIFIILGFVSWVLTSIFSSYMIIQLQKTYSSYSALSLVYKNL